MEIEDGMPDEDTTQRRDPYGAEDTADTQEAIIGGTEKRPFRLQLYL